MDLKEEAFRASELLKNKVVKSVSRHREDEVIIIFTDGTTLYINKVEKGLDLSIT